MKNMFFDRATWMVGAALVLLLLAGCGSGYKVLPPGTILSISPTTVWLYPLETEDLKGPCAFDLLLQEPTVPQAGTLVVYERGDSSDLYRDKTLQATALSLHYSMLFAHECDAQSTGAFQASASEGQARVLFTALTQLAANNNRPELATGGVVLYGFSAAGVLTATMANENPERILGTIQYASGDTHVNLEDVPITPATAKIPALLLANAEDNKSGTHRSLDYFLRGRLLGAPWAYGVQNATDHCCTLSTRPVLVPWLKAVAAAQTGSSAGTTANYPGQVYSEFTCKPDHTMDAQGYTDCEFSTASLVKSVPVSGGVYGWLPDAASATAWLSWVLNTETN